MRRAAMLCCVCLSGLVLGCGSEPSVRSQTSSAMQDVPSARPNRMLTVLYAGSMTKVMETSIRSDFDTSTQDRIQGEGAGSNALAQLIKSGLKQADVFISASPSVNERDLMGTANHNVVSWYLTLARDQLVIAYSPNSRFSKDLDAAERGTKQWYGVIGEPGFRFGRTDPKLDPKGINTLLMMQLAERYYRQHGLAKRLLGVQDNPEQVYPEETLLARLAAGQVDAVVAYKHEAIEWKLPYISLPGQINLGDIAQARRYAAATVQIGGQWQHGAPIVFTVTIPNKARNPIAATRFVRYLLTGQGHNLLMRDGFGDIPTYAGGSIKLLPTVFRDLVRGTWPRGSERSQK